MAFDRVALAPDIGAMWTLERRIGLAATRRLPYFGSVIGAAEAHSLGLVDELCQPGSAQSVAVALAEEFASRSTTANAVIKRALSNRAATLSGALKQELEGSANLYRSREYRAALMASTEPLMTGIRVRPLRPRLKRARASRIQTVAVRPPSTTRDAPVIYEEAGEARKSSAASSSCCSPKRPRMLLSTTI